MSLEKKIPPVYNISSTELHDDTATKHQAKKGGYSTGWYG